MIQRNLLLNDDRDTLPKHWKDLVVVLWEADDSGPPDAESVDTAFHRITGFPARPGSDHYGVAKVDEGDSVYYFYQGGWVYAQTFDGGWVGVLTQRQ